MDQSQDIKLDIKILFETNCSTPSKNGTKFQPRTCYCIRGIIYKLTKLETRAKIKFLKI